MNDPRREVLVLGGGPDAEREVSLASAAAVATALRSAGYTVHERTIDRVTLDELRDLPGDVIAPILHGPFGEGGPLQDLLERDGRPYIGAPPRAARLAMDKVASKLIAATLGASVTPSAVFDPDDPACPLELPVVVKPVKEGSTIGLFMCKTHEEWDAAHRATAARARPAMVEPCICGREITVGIVAGEALPIIEIAPAEGLYDYDAKYQRDDTRYTARPELPAGVAERVSRDALALARAIGCACLSRADFLLTPDGTPWLLEINTMPGFTDHSLVPMAARATGVEMPTLCARLVDEAVTQRGPRPAAEGVFA